MNKQFSDYTGDSIGKTNNVSTTYSVIGIRYSCGVL